MSSGFAKKSERTICSPLRRGAGGGARTRTVLPPRDFKSLASACFATPARSVTSYHRSQHLSSTGNPDGRRALGEYYRQNPADDLPELTCDLRVNDPHLLTMPCIESLDALEPCGNGNPQPLLCITGARLVNAVPIGGGRHLRLHFAKGGYNYAGIFFSCTPAQLGVRIGQWVDVAFTPQINEFRGRRSVQLLVTDVRPSDPLPLCRALLKNQCIPAWDTVDLYPLRADFAVAWRWLNAPVAFPLEELPARAPMRPEKFCVCLRVMAEMGLAAVDFDGETLRLRPLPTSGKVDLGASKLLQALRDRRQKLL